MQIKLGGPVIKNQEGKNGYWVAISGLGDNIVRTSHRSRLANSVPYFLASLTARCGPKTQRPKDPKAAEKILHCQPHSFYFIDYAKIIVPTFSPLHPST